MPDGKTGDNLRVPPSPRWTETRGGMLWQPILISSSSNSMNSSDC